MPSFKILVKNFCFKRRLRIRDSKTLSFLYLTASAFVPIAVSILFVLILCFYDFQLFDNSGAVLVCGALVAELFYFSASPELREKAARFDGEFASAELNEDSNCIYYRSRSYVHDVRTSQGQVTGVSKTAKGASYNLTNDIDELELLKNIDKTKYAESRDVAYWIPSSAMRSVDLTIAKTLALLAVLGTLVWGFGDSVVYAVVGQAVGCA